MNSLILKANEMTDTLQKMRRYLHQNAYSGFSTENAEYVKTKLSEMGITPSDCGKAGVTACIGKGAPVFLLRADMDALPMKEQTDLTYASVTDCMHACGHDLHTAMLLGAAKLLKENEAALKGTVKLMFQPAEERLEGAIDMIENGVLENPAPNAAMMLHVVPGPLPTGTVFFSTDSVMMPSSDHFTVDVYGKSCHGSTPEKGIDAITAAAHIILALQQLCAVERGMKDPVIYSIGHIEGGDAPNIIANHVAFSGTVRSYDQNLRQKFKDRMAEVAEYTAKASKASAKVTFTSGTPMFQNNTDLSSSVARNAAELLGKEMVIHAPGAGVGSEDFAYISHKIPTILGSLYAGADGYTLHHPQIKFDESVLPLGTALLAHSAMTWLKENEKHCP